MTIAKPTDPDTVALIEAPAPGSSGTDRKKQPTCSDIANDRVSISFVRRLAISVTFRLPVIREQRGDGLVFRQGFRSGAFTGRFFFHRHW
jgi:hypothetical protein